MDDRCKNLFPERVLNPKPKNAGPCSQDFLLLLLFPLLLCPSPVLSTLPESVLPLERAIPELRCLNRKVTVTSHCNKITRFGIAECQQNRNQITNQKSWGKSKVHSFLGVVAFLQHAPKKSSAAKMEGFPQNSRESAQIVGGQK